MSQLEQTHLVSLIVCLDDLNNATPVFPGLTSSPCHSCSVGCHLLTTQKVLPLSRIGRYPVQRHRLPSQRRSMLISRFYFNWFHLTVKTDLGFFFFFFRVFKYLPDYSILFLFLEDEPSHYFNSSFILCPKDDRLSGELTCIHLLVYSFIQHVSV